MLRLYITDRHLLGGTAALLENISRQILLGVDRIQIREKDLTGRELVALARRVVELAAPYETQILINSRMDVAVAAGAHGIHLPAGSVAPSEYKRCAPRLIVGVSCHNRAELRRAAEQGADYAVLGPVFAPLSKRVEGLVLGLDLFEELVREVKIPVLALGGITRDNIAACEEAGAAGVAGISLFQS